MRRSHWAAKCNKCHVKRGTGAAAGDHAIHPLPEHLLQASWSGDTGCAQPQLIALQTPHTTPLTSQRLLKAAVANPGQVFLCLAHSSH